MEIPLGNRIRELPGPVLVTGHTGFKGTWMTFLLEFLEIPVIGYSLVAEKESLFDRANRTGDISEAFADIRNYEALEWFIDSQKPSTIIHMAAQPLVLESYKKPREAFDVNVMGTVNLLDIAFRKDFVKAIIVVTTDKVYKNDNSGQAFTESDPLQGKDPYSASKVGTEAVVAAWQQISQISGGPKVISVRSGNVIGGGDFAENRIIPDLIKGVIHGKPVEIRNPESTRPWQHVLDPLGGYLKALEALLTEKNFSSINFGPNTRSLKVREVIEVGQKLFPEIVTVDLISNSNEKFMESKTLELNPNLAKNILNWEPRWNQISAIHNTFSWWKSFLSEHASPRELCLKDICSYFDIDEIKFSK
jgi:CDP-glucose 4,6-dehydratase